MDINGYEQYRVGDKRPEWIWPGSLVRSDFDSLSWSLTIGFPGITPEEINELQDGSVSFAFTVLNDTVFLLFKIGSFAWMDAPYEPRMNPRTDYSVFPTDTGAALTIFIVDCGSGELKAIRVLGLGNILSNNLHETCRILLRKGTITREEYHNRVEKTYEEYPTSDDMLKTVEIQHIYVLAKG